LAPVQWHVYPLASLKDDELAGRVGLQPKELNKVIAVLANDALVKVYVWEAIVLRDFIDIYPFRFRQNELKEGAQRSVGKQYYYIDYEHFCNVVKWRIARMRHKIDHKLRNVRTNQLLLRFPSDSALGN
jgi:transcription initiation factor TFIIE subunit alpha